MFIPFEGKYKTEKDTPAYKIFHWPWPVIIPNIFLRTTDDLEENGVYTSTVPEFDEALANQSSATTRTIAELACLLDAGCEFILENKAENSPKIYQIVIEHMKDWAEHLNTDGARFYNNIDEETTAIVVGDIAKLENLAKAVYSSGIKPIPKRFDPGSLVGQFQRFNGKAISAPDQFAAPMETITKPKVDLEVLDIFADVIKTPTTISRIKKWQV